MAQLLRRGALAGALLVGGCLSFDHFGGAPDGGGLVVDGGAADGALGDDGALTDALAPVDADQTGACIGAGVRVTTGAAQHPVDGFCPLHPGAALCMGFGVEGMIGLCNGQSLYAPSATGAFDADDSDPHIHASEDASGLYVETAELSGGFELEFQLVPNGGAVSGGNAHFRVLLLAASGGADDYHRPGYLFEFEGRYVAVPDGRLSVYRFAGAEAKTLVWQYSGAVWAEVAAADFHFRLRHRPEQPPSERWEVFVGSSAVVGTATPEATPFGGPYGLLSVFVVSDFFLSEVDDLAATQIAP